MGGLVGGSSQQLLARLSKCVEDVPQRAQHAHILRQSPPRLQILCMRDSFQP